MIDYGINDDFIKSIGDTLQPDTSALFLLIRKSQPEKVLAELSGFKGASFVPPVAGTGSQAPGCPDEGACTESERRCSGCRFNGDGNIGYRVTIRRT